MTNQPKRKPKLKQFAEEQGIELPSQGEILDEATKNIESRYSHDREQIKNRFDSLISETHDEAYRLYLHYEQEYGGRVLGAFFDSLISSGVISDISEVGTVLGKYFNWLDRFFLSLKQSRTSRAGKTFEGITGNLFKALEYPFEEQTIIDDGSTPDFLMPSAARYRTNPLDCIIFTSKRTLRERWRQIVTEGTRGFGFYLATIDEEISKNQLNEIHNNRIYVVVPETIKERCYPKTENVISFSQFFNDHLDPAVERWRRNGII